MIVQERGAGSGEMAEARPEAAERRVFAVLGMRPEPAGYSVAKFSRSA